MTATKLARIAKLSASDPLKRFDSVMELLLSGYSDVFSDHMVRSPGRS